MKSKKPTILIFAGNEICRGPIATITGAFIEGLQKRYNFIPFYAERRYGAISKSDFNLINVYYFLKHLALWVCKIIRYRPDIAHYAITSYWNLEKSLIFLTISKAFGCKTIGHLHGGAFDDFWDSISRTRKKLAVSLFKRLDHMIVLSEYWKHFLKREIRIKHVSIVHNVIDKKFEEGTLKTTNFKDGNVLFLGSMGKRKGVYDIIEAIRGMKKSLKVKVELVGAEAGKNDLENIKSLITKYELNDYIEIKGPLYGVDKIKAFKNASIFLFPSHNENFPLVILEAACAGLPIITTPVGAIPDFFLHRKSVYFVEPGNIEQIADAIIKLLHNKEKREALGKEARKIFINKLARGQIYQSLDDVYQKVFNN